MSRKPLCKYWLSCSTCCRGCLPPAPPPPPPLLSASASLATPFVTAQWSRCPTKKGHSSSTVAMAGVPQWANIGGRGVGGVVFCSSWGGWRTRAAGDYGPIHTPAMGLSWRLDKQDTFYVGLLDLPCPAPALPHVW